MELTPSGLSEFTKSAYRTQNPNKAQQLPLLLPGNGCKEETLAQNPKGEKLRREFKAAPVPFLTQPPILSHLLLTSRRACGTEFRRQRHFACRLTSGTDSHISMLLAGFKGQHTQTTETLNHPTKMFRLLVLKRRGRHPQISCCKCIWFLQNLNKVFTSLLYTAQKTGPSFFEFSLPNLCQEGLYPGEVLDATGRG